MDFTTLTNKKQELKKERLKKGRQAIKPSVKINNYKSSFKTEEDINNLLRVPKNRSRRIWSAIAKHKDALEVEHLNYLQSYDNILETLKERRLWLDVSLRDLRCEKNNPCITDGYQDLEECYQETRAKLNYYEVLRDIESPYKDDLDRYNKMSVGIYNCAKRFVYSNAILPDGSISSGHLEKAEFCKYRLCPVCSVIKSKKSFLNGQKALELLDLSKYQILFVTLTIKNAPASDLNKAIDKLLNGYTDLFRNNRSLSKVVKGSFKSLEVTYNFHSRTFHPHLHCLWFVPSNYFSKDFENYITKENLWTLWKKALNVDYNPSVDISRIKPNTRKGIDSLKSALLEVLKYSFKFEDDKPVTPEIVVALDKALKGRRLQTKTGVIREAYRELNLPVDDVEDVDLSEFEEASVPDQEEEPQKYQINIYEFQDKSYTNTASFLTDKEALDNYRKQNQKENECAKEIVNQWNIAKHNLKVLEAIKIRSSLARYCLENGCSLREAEALWRSGDLAEATALSLFGI